MSAGTSGARANRSGDAFEVRIIGKLTALGFAAVTRREFLTRDVPGPCFCRHLPLGVSVYGSAVKVDVVLRHPDSYPGGLVIEAKWQSAAGSVDEKFPYLAANIKQEYPLPAVVVIDGGGYKAGAERWLRAQVDGERLLAVMSWQEFSAWAPRALLVGGRDSPTPSNASSTFRSDGQYAPRDSLQEPLRQDTVAERMARHLEVSEAPPLSGPHP